VATVPEPPAMYDDEKNGTSSFAALVCVASTIFELENSPVNSTTQEEKKSKLYPLLKSYSAAARSNKLSKIRQVTVELLPKSNETSP